MTDADLEYLKCLLARLGRAEDLEDAKTIGRAMYARLFGLVPKLEDEERE